MKLICESSTVYVSRRSGRLQLVLCLSCCQ
uniref:Uncharacterized protein n=1 Tax=Arundo donax TaxID=35708 RepID=A0A0A9B863_ARUDO